MVWDPHPRGGDPVAGAALCTPNRAEARHFVAAAGPPGADLTAADLPDQAAALQRHWRARAVCVTDGERGAVTALEDGELAVSRAMPCPNGVDTCGAGDRFSAGVAVALGRGASPFSAVLEAHADVGRWLTEGGVGGIILDRDDIDRDIDRDIGRRDAGVSADEVVERVRARGGTVVATGGCFDVLHAGHLALLEQARALGDCLVVLLNSDASVRRLKGASRPVHSAADRGRLLEGLACVDAVMVFEDDDPTATLARLRPDVWVKGGDYRDQDLPEARTVRALGGRVALVPYLDGHSTTRILQRLEVPSHRAIRTPSGTAMTEGER
jgi:rfaE bifunctional protein nucleotidyltransferase chain/domain